MLRANFKYWLKKGYKAIDAIERARVDVASDKRRYPLDLTHRNSYFAAYGSRRMLWIERPEDYGLRRVGYCDEISGSIRHRGWFLDDDCHEIVRGSVYRLPSKNRESRFIAAYDDPWNDGPICADLETIYDCEISAARAADSIAERMAERECYYQRAFRAGVMYAETVSEIKETRNWIKDLLVERKSARKLESDFPTICNTIRAKISDLLNDLRKLRDKRDRLKSGDYSEGDYFYGFSLRDADLVAAFNDGAGERVIS
mgnify:CR=1 FL=1